MEQWARPRKAVDALVILPCGRVGTVDFGGEERPLEWLQQVLFQKFGGQFMSQPPRLMSLCGCKRHWSQLPVGTQLKVKTDMTFIALPEAFGKAIGMIPELPHRDSVVQLAPPMPKQMPQRLQQQLSEAREQAMESGRKQKPVSSGPVLRPKSMCPTPAMVQAKAPPLQVAQDPAAGVPSGADDEETPVPVSTVGDTTTNIGDDAEEPETPVLDTQVQAVATDLPQEEETPLHRAHRIPAGFVNVIFGKMRVRFDVTTPCPVANIARTLVPGMLLDGIVAELDGFLVGHDDILMGDLTSRDVFQSTIVFRPRGLRGGAPSERGEEAIRDMLSSLLQTKGLQGKALQTKLAEAFQKLSKAELVAWSQKGTWQALKVMVGTRITFLERQRRDKDPWTVSDPWSEALASSSSDPKKATSKPDSAPQISLIAEVWKTRISRNPRYSNAPPKDPQVFPS